MSVPFPLWSVPVGLLLLVGGWGLYVYVLHPAWRKERRVIRACEHAFDEGDYRLVRLRVSLEDPSIADLVPASPFRTRKSTRYFTYKIETVEGAEPDFSGMRQEERDLVRHYLRRGADVPHHGKEVVRPAEARADERTAQNAA